MSQGPAAPGSQRSEPHLGQQHSQHQVAALELTPVQGPTREVGLLRGFLPVLERCL